FQEIAEGPEARVEQDVADLCQHLTSRAIDLERKRRLIGQQFLQDRGAALVEDEQRISLDRTGKDLVHACYFVLRQWTEIRPHLLDGAHRDLRDLELHAMAGQLRERCSGAAEAD